MVIELSIIDTIGPFMSKKHPVRNWSKVPFGFYEGLENPEKEFAQVIENFRIFAKKAHEIEYNVVSIDDLAHMVNSDIYPAVLRAKIGKFKKLYEEIFAICREYDLKIFVNFDLMFFNESIVSHTEGKHQKIREILQEFLTTLFLDYNVDGVITRMGESDGVDVDSIFKSRITIKTPAQANRYIKELLPIFEKHNKTWIFRTWTLGKGKIGDLMWNQKTYQKTFKDINSPNFIVSMKYGEGDFFRNMRLNPLLSGGSQNTLIELQAKREYDGFGQLPFYTGWDYEKYYQLLCDDKKLKGIMVWCQTGGWFASDNITFLDKSSPWTELNTISTIKIFKGETADDAAMAVLKDRQKLLFLKEYYKISGLILYPETSQDRYFKRLKLHPAMWNFWGNITVNNVTASLAGGFYGKKINVKALDIKKLYQMGEQCGIADMEFIRDTLLVFYACRLALAGRIPLAMLRHISQKYLEEYPDFLVFNISNKAKLKKVYSLAFSLLTRKNSKYRFADLVLLNPIVLMLAYKIFTAVDSKSLPAFADKEATAVSDFFG